MKEHTVDECDPEDKANAKPHVHKANGGHPACSEHGMMVRPQKQWRCATPKCPVSWNPSK